MFRANVSFVVTLSVSRGVCDVSVCPLSVVTCILSEVTCQISMIYFHGSQFPHSVSEPPGENRAANAWRWLLSLPSTRSSQALMRDEWPILHRHRLSRALLVPHRRVDAPVGKKQPHATLPMATSHIHREPENSRTRRQRKGPVGHVPRFLQHRLLRRWDAEFILLIRRISSRDQWQLRCISETHVFSQCVGSITGVKYMLSCLWAHVYLASYAMYHVSEL